MDRKKSLFVVVLMAVMLLAIDAGLYLLWKPGFAFLTGVFALYGFLHGAVDFRGWLVSEKSNLEPYNAPATHKRTRPAAEPVKAEVIQVDPIPPMDATDFDVFFAGVVAQTNAG